MAVLAVAAVSSYAGWAAFGTTAAATMGWNIGMVVGGALFGPKMPDQYGPRLGDLKVQASTYGNPIPIVYGTARVAGNMIWSTDRIETPHTQEQGKGGGGGSYTNYTVSQSFAICVSECEIFGIPKIWANGKLIYNLADTADAGSITSSVKAASSIRIYTGSETQTADSLIQAHVGAADTPAYRGVAYVVFENMQLDEYGKNLPNLEFEVVNSGSFTRPGYDSLFTKISGEAEFYDSTTNLVHYQTGWTTVETFDVGLRQWVGAYTLPVQTWRIFKGPGNTAYSVGQYDMYKLDTTTGATLNTWSGSVLGLGGYRASDDTFIAAEGYGDVYYLRDGDTSVTLMHQFSGVLWQTMVIAGSNIVLYSDYSKRIAVINWANTVVLDYSTGTPTGSFTWSYSGTYDSVRNKVHFMASDYATMWTVSLDTLAVVSTVISGGDDEMAYPLYLQGSDSLVVSSYGVVSAAITILDPDTLAVIETFAYTGSPVPSGTVFEYTRSPDKLLLMQTDGLVCGFVPVQKRISSNQVTLSSIVSDICIRSGLTAGQIDVTALTDQVHGYVVQRGTGRSQIEQLMQAFYFDAVESDGKVKFVKRGGSAALTIPEDDLSAHEYGSSPPDTLVIGRKQEMELPVEVNVQYLDTAAAYAVGTQPSQRLTTESEHKTSLNFAIAMTASKAKQVADVLMYDAWTSRAGFDFQTSWKYCYLEPTDVINVVKNGKTYTVRIVDEDFAVTSNRKAVLEDATIYTQTATAAALPVPVDTVSQIPETDLMLLDIPLLRDIDDGYGFYAAACGHVAGWRGAQPFKSNDAGETWQSFGPVMLNGATIGQASTVLGDFTQNIFDELNSVTVILINGTLSSDTEINVLNGANAALIGNEIIQFRTATLTGTNEYKLTGLLRGRLGTEWARSTHVVNERFILLETSTIYPMLGVTAEYDLNRHYKGASIGGFLDDATSITFANTAVQAMPYSPVHLGGGRNAAGDLILTWIRRTRISGGWNNFADVPLGEASEAYVVEIYNGSGYATVLRTISGLTSATTTYTAAQQTTDFGSPQATVYWKVYQVSAVVGNGYEARGVN